MINLPRSLAVIIIPQPCRVTTAILCWTWEAIQVLSLSLWELSQTTSSIIQTLLLLLLLTLLGLELILPSNRGPSAWSFALKTTASHFFLLPLGPSSQLSFLNWVQYVPI